MKVRVLDAVGLARMRAWHAGVSDAPGTFDDVAAILEDDAVARVVGEVRDDLVPESVPPNRFAAAAHLHALMPDLIRDCGVDVGSSDGFWSWLAGTWRHHLVKPATKSASGPRLGESARWISELSSSRRRYRHLLAGPYMLYARHADGPERVRFLLDNPLHTPGELAGQVGASEVLISSPVAMEVASRLYWDKEAGTVRSNLRGKNRPGTVRRLAAVLNQFARTYSFEDQGRDALEEILPGEFVR